MRLALLLAVVVVAGACRAAPPDALVMLADRDVESLDPHASGGIFQTQNALANVYEGLVTRDRDMRIQPALAVSWTNPDDHTWDFSLRPGVVFQNGAPLTAQDVVASIERGRDHPRSVVRGALQGVVEVNSPAAGVVRLRTLEADASLITRLPDVFVAPAASLPPASTEAAAEAPPGTGPYRVVSRVPGQSLDLERFERHWRGAPGFRSVRILPVTFGTAEGDRATAAGGAATFYAIPGSPAHDRAVREYVEHPRLGVSVQYLGFDLRDRDSPSVRLPHGVSGNPFRDVRVRRAMALAIDHERLQAGVFRGRARVASQMVPPEVVGFDPALPLPRHDVAQARRLLAQTPYAAGFEVDLDVRALVEQYAPHIVTALAEIGIRAVVRTPSEGDFFASLREGRSSLYLLRFSCRTGDAQEFLDKLVHSRDETRGYGIFNFSYEQSPAPELDVQIEAARRELLAVERLTMLRHLMRRIVEEQVYVPLLSEQSVVFLSRGVEWTPRADGFRLFAEMKPAR